MESELVFLTPFSRSGAITIRERESLASTCGQIPILFTGYVPNGQLIASDQAFAMAGWWDRMCLIVTHNRGLGDVNRWRNMMMKFEP